MQLTGRNEATDAKEEGFVYSFFLGFLFVCLFRKWGFFPLKQNKTISNLRQYIEKSYLLICMQLWFCPDALGLKILL